MDLTCHATTGPAPGHASPSTARDPAETENNSGDQVLENSENYCCDDVNIISRLVQREIPGSLEIFSEPACVVWGRNKK